MKPLGPVELLSAPSSVRQWSVQGQRYLAADDGLWRVGDAHAHWAGVHANALVADGERLLARTEHGNVRSDGLSEGPLLRVGLDAVARFGPQGWSIDGLALPHGARTSPQLAPLPRGLGATWCTFGQWFRLDAAGLRATRVREENWLPAEPGEQRDAAVAAEGDSLWGPGRARWDLLTGASRPLAHWLDGVATAWQDGAACAEAEGGRVLAYVGDTVQRWELPLRRDSIASLDWDGELVAVTALGRRWLLRADGVVERLSGRVMPEEPEAIEALGLSFDGVAQVAETTWLYRRDGLLLRG